MIEIERSQEAFEYDIQGLCKAFYPTEQIVFLPIGQKVTKKETTLWLEVQMDSEGVFVKAGNQDGQWERQAKALKTDSRAYKNAVKQSVYQLLVEITGRTLPWGTLTGVRPSKLAMERLEIGESKEQVYEYMKKQYFASDEKIELAYTVAKKEWDILNAIDYTNGYSLYVGIPFCPSRCLYCSFTSYPMEQFGKLVEQYLDALYKEIAFAASVKWKKKLTSIYIGGGTPTTLTAEQLRKLISTIKKSFPMEYVKEFTVEAGRPDSIDMDKLKVLKEEGVTRISINPQTMNQKTLDHIGRKHTVEEVEQAFEMARKAGHDDINMDLIVGLPGEGEAEIKETLRWVQKLNPDSLTVHSLVVKRAARLNLNMDEEEEFMTWNTDSMFAQAAAFAREQGYLPYYMYRQKNATGIRQDIRENVGYAKPGKESIYNVLIMEEKQSILALGAGASTKFLLPEEEKKIERVENVKSIIDYVERIDEMIARKQHFLQEHGQELLE